MDETTLALPKNISSHTFPDSSPLFFLSSSPPLLYHVSVFRKADFLLLGVALGLALFGLAMIASVSVYQSYQLTERFVASGVWEPTTNPNSFYLWRSFRHILVALAALTTTAIIPYRLWGRLARLLFLMNLGLLVLLFIPGFGNEFGTARSWLQVGFLSVQPSEFLKLTLVFYLSVWLQKKESLIATFKEGFLPFVVLLCLSTFLVAVQPDLGSFLVFTVVASVMFFVAGGNIFHLFLGGATAALLGLPIILNQEYVRNRFSVFFSILRNPDTLTCREGICFQIYQALLAVGSGGIFGVGYGKSIQKFGYLPEVQADTIFAAMAEELGFFRILIVLGLYGLFVYRGLKVARGAPDRFGLLLATGLTTGIAFQALLNISVNLSLFPITGITLPFISYGGSSLVATMAAVGVILNISMHSSEEGMTVQRRQRKEQLISLKRYIHD